MHISMLEKDTLLVQAVVDKAVTMVTDFGKDVAATIKQLRQSNAALKSEAEQLRNKLAAIKQNTFPPDTDSKGGFKCSPALQSAITQARAEQLQLSKAYAEEETEYRQTLFDSIAKRQQKLLEAIEYKNAVEHGSYSEATIAINRKKQEVLQHGVTVEIGISGHTAKGLYDSEQKTLFTFETLDNTPLSLHGCEYQIVKAELSPVGAGNTYTLRLIH